MLEQMLRGVPKISWFPGHMCRATKMIENYIQEADVFLEVRDARAPLSSFNRNVDEIIKLHRKTKVVLFNKFDLCD